MNNKTLVISALSLALAAGALPADARVWTLQDCIDYALANNITLQKNTLTRLSAEEDVKQSQSALLPSLTASTSHNVTYNPWPDTGSYSIAGDKVQTNVDKVYYNGSYAVTGSWTVWNGNRNRNQIKSDKIAVEQAELNSATTANSIQEQITQLYVQILYTKEAIEVNKAALETSKANEERGKQYVEVGSMSRADLAQLTAERAQDEYAIVQAESTLRDYKRQLKQLLQITDQEEFDVVADEPTDAMALQEIPGVTGVYEQALNHRPEIKNALLGIEASDLDIKMAKAQKIPTITANAGVSTTTTTMSNNGWGTQLKNNFGVNGGVSVSIPIFDNRSTKTAVNKARLNKQSYQLDLRNEQTNLYSTIENYWLQAVNNQAQYKSAKVSTQSAQESYDLLSEQFNNNLKNTIELMTGKDTLLQAQQTELQAKYLTIYNINMLKFYETGTLKK